MVNEQIFMSTVFLAGILSFFAPCVLPLLPVYIGILSGERRDKIVHLGKLELNLVSIIRTMFFVLGLSTSFILLGFGAGSLGSLINSDTFIVVIGIIVIILGIHQTGLIKINFLERQKKLELKSSRRNDLLGTYLLGFTFSFGWTPCIGPILGAVLSISASEGQAIYGAWLMSIFALGLMIPFLVISLFSSFLLSKVKRLNRHLDKIRIAGGVLIIIMGILLVTRNLNIIVIFFEKIIN